MSDRTKVKKEISQYGIDRLQEVKNEGEVTGQQVEGRSRETWSPGGRRRVGVRIWSQDLV